MTPAADLVLPVSTSEETLGMQPIEITKVISEGRVLVDTDSLLSGDSLLVPLVYEWMKAMRQRSSDSSGSELVIQCDRDIQFAAVKKIMYTCSKAGFTDFLVLVVREE